MEKGTRKDFFISYTSADRSLAEWIAWQLEQVNYTTIIQAWDIQPGSNFVLEMDTAAKTAERTIAVLSLAQLQQAGIAKLQCPACSATWAARIRGDTVLFPSHPPRTTRMTQDIPRWIKQEAGWILYQKGS